MAAIAANFWPYLGTKCTSTNENRVLPCQVHQPAAQYLLLFQSEHYGLSVEAKWYHEAVVKAKPARQNDGKSARMSNGAGYLVPTSH
jgi:hypothetical protein